MERKKKKPNEKTTTSEENNEERVRKTETDRERRWDTLKRTLACSPEQK